MLVDDAEMLFGLEHTDILDRVVLIGRDVDHGLILTRTTDDLACC